MDALQFAYWLRGALEVFGEQALTKEQVEVISKHLSLVFEHVAKDKQPVSKTDWQKVIKEMPRFEITEDDLKKSFKKEYCSSTSTYYPTTVSCSPKIC